MPYLIQIVSKFTGRDYYEFYYKSKMFISTPDFYNICYLLGMIAIFVFLWYTKRNIKDKKEKSIFNFFLIIFYISVCLRFIATFSSSFMLVNRFGAYFFWALIVLIPYSIKYFFKQNLVYLYSALVYIFAAIYFIISVKVRKSNGIYSYYLTFQEFSVLWWISVICLVSLILAIIINSLRLLYKRKNYEKDKCNNSSV